MFDRCSKLCEEACFLCRGCGIIIKNGRPQGSPLRRIGGRAMNMPKRKQIRLPKYDYSTPGAYFVTICTADRRCILSTISVGTSIARPRGKKQISERTCANPWNDVNLPNFSCSRSADTAGRAMLVPTDRFCRQDGNIKVASAQ